MWVWNDSLDTSAGQTQVGGDCCASQKAGMPPMRTVHGGSTPIGVGGRWLEMTWCGKKAQLGCQVGKTAYNDEEAKRVDGAGGGEH